MGFFSNLIKDVTGKTAKEASEEAAAGRTRAAGAINTVQEDLFRQPAEQSLEAVNLLAQALGISGPEAQQAFFANFQDDPGFQATQQAGIRAIDQAASAGGQLNTGGRLKSLFEFGQQGQNQQFQQRLANLAGFQPGARGAFANLELAEQGQRVGASDALAQGIANAGANRVGFAGGLLGTAANLLGRTSFLQNLGAPTGGPTNIIPGR